VPTDYKNQDASGSSLTALFFLLTLENCTLIESACQVGVRGSGAGELRACALAFRAVLIRYHMLTSQLSQLVAWRQLYRTSPSGSLAANMLSTADTSLLVVNSTFRVIGEATHSSSCVFAGNTSGSAYWIVGGKVTIYSC